MKPLLLLFDWLDVQVDVETMHSNLEIDPEHVLIILSEDIFILSYEMYYVFFLRRWQALTYENGLGVSLISKIYLSQSILMGGSRCSRRTSQRVF